jgi:two-component system sensor kinase FixL
MHLTPQRDAPPHQAWRRHLEDREQLLFTSRALTAAEIASTLGHELNQPIGTVVNLLRGIRKRLSQLDDSTMKPIDHGLQMALDQAIFASRIITRLRDYAQARQPRLEQVSLAEVVHESLALLDWEVQRDGVLVNIARPAGDFELMADRLMLQQLFVNLMRNALEAMRVTNEPVKRLDIAFTRSNSGRDIELSLCDNGCGLPADAEARLFEPFQSSKPNGMGMGLNICRSFVELHQGRLWFTRNEHIQPGATGVTFHVLLPIHTGQAT